MPNPVLRPVSDRSRDLLWGLVLDQRNGRTKSLVDTEVELALSARADGVPVHRDESGAIVGVGTAI